MHCPNCNRDVAPKSKVDWDAAFTSMGVSLIVILILLAVLSAFCTFGLGPAAILCISIYKGYCGGTYKYCPICYTALTKPAGWRGSASSLSDKVDEQKKD